MPIFRPLLLATLLLAPCLHAFAQPSSCPKFFPGGEPPALVNGKLAQRTTMLCNDAYVVLASGVTHGALWSAELVTRAEVKAAHGTAREGEFHPEDRLPVADRAQLGDYRGSGYDRGHMAPSGDQPDEVAQQQTFSLANMVPQTPELNRGVWAKIEMAVRHMAERRGELFVVTGPAFVGQQISSIGPDNVLVPTSTWKAVFDPRADATGVYTCTNADQPQCQVVSVDALVRAVGIDPFPALPAAMKEQAMTLPEPGADRQSAGRRGRFRRKPGAEP
jgi:endonuclease G